MLTQQDLGILLAPFKPDEHEFLRGLVYITETAVTSRLEQIDPAWAMTQPVINLRNGVGTNSEVVVTATLGITLLGVTRYGTGMASTSLRKDGVTEANEAEKSAVTDALKRAGRMFGIGRYLLSTPSYVKDEASLAKWLGSTSTEKPKSPFKGAGKKDTPPKDNTPNEPPSVLLWRTDEPTKNTFAHDHPHYRAWLKWAFDEGIIDANVTVTQLKEIIKQHHDNIQLGGK